nr:hypothetical protein [uncultured Microbacterium sp.]
MAAVLLAAVILPAALLAAGVREVVGFAAEPDSVVFVAVVFAGVVFAAAAGAAEVLDAADFDEFRAAAARAAAVVVVRFADGPRPADALSARESFSAGSATTSMVAAALSAADFEGVLGVAGFFTAGFLVGVFLAGAVAASATCSVRSSGEAVTVLRYQRETTFFCSAQQSARGADIRPICVASGRN